MGKKPIDYDDGRTISDMNVEGMPWYKKNVQSNIKHNYQNYSRKEKKRMILACYKSILPIAGGFILLYFLVFMFLDIFWLK